MPAVSEKQRRMMAIAEHAPEKLNKKNKGVLKMSHSQLHDFASKKETKDKPGRSLVDMEFMESSAKTTKLEGSHPGLSGPQVWGACELGANDGAHRGPTEGMHRGAEVCHRGPDTAFRTEEINPQHYGRDYETMPYKDMFKTNYRQRELNIRQESDLNYQECETPGAVSGEYESSLAYGTVGFKKVPVEETDNRTFERQQLYHREQHEFDEHEAGEDDEHHEYKHR